MIRLNCPVQNYAWGKLGLDSTVAALKAAADPAFAPDPAQPYAELWVGTHPKAPATLHATPEQTLSRHLADNPAHIGDKLAPILKDKFSSDEGLGLPFLLKVLSVQKALSIQVHPNKGSKLEAEAVALHAADPTNYKDDNHKPEMAIALTPFELLCGFRPAAEILQHLRDTPELFELVGGPAFVLLQDVVAAGAAAESAEAKAALKAAFASLMSQPGFLVEKNVQSLTERVGLALQKEEPNSAPFILAELLIRLNYSFPGDVGVLAPFFLNHFRLQPGEAVFLGPNEPHAYLYGDCIECMATSDNVIRAGLTPKFKDVPALLSHLTYRMAGPDENKFSSSVDPSNPAVTVYDPPAPEFAVHRIEATSALEVEALSVCSVLLVTSGEGTAGGKEALGKGFVFFVPAHVGLSLRPTRGVLVLFQAFAHPKDALNL